VTKATRTITAFLDGEDSPDISNPIHSTGVAQQYGFKAALVGGVTVYGWCAPAIIEALGESWLDEGWAEIAFRRPVYPGDEMTAAVWDDADGWRLEMANGAGAVCIRGVLGLGRAGWADELQTSTRLKAEPPAEPREELTLDTAPAGAELRPMWVPFTAEDAHAYARDLQKDHAERWTRAVKPRIHPGWLAARMTPLLKHTYRYGPSIHARSRIQHLRPGYATQGAVVAGRFLRAYEENGHHYAELDGQVFKGDMTEIARIRHTTIFRPRMAE
jgi:hypothetical protein